MTLGMPRGRRVGRLMPPLGGLSVGRPVRVSALRGFPAGGGYAAAVIASKPVSYWRLDEAIGTRASDQMRQANGTYVGTIVKGVNGPPGISDGAGVRTTGGGGTWVDCGNTTISAAAYSLMCWVFLTGTTGDRGIFGQWFANVGALMYRATSATIGAGHRSTFITSGTLALNVWHSCFATWDGANLRLYIDGRLAAGPSANATAPGTGSNWVIGTYAVAGPTFASRIIDGSLAEAAYWNRALPAGNIAHLYAIGSGRY